MGYEGSDFLRLDLFARISLGFVAGESRDIDLKACR